MCFRLQLGRKVSHFIGVRAGPQVRPGGVVRVVTEVEIALGVARSIIARPDGSRRRSALLQREILRLEAGALVRPVRPLHVDAVAALDEAGVYDPRQPVELSSL